MGCQIVFLNERENHFSLRNKIEDEEIRVIEIHDEDQLQKHTNGLGVDAVMVYVDPRRSHSKNKMEHWPLRFACRLIAITPETDMQYHHDLLTTWADDVIVIDATLSLVKAKCLALLRRKKLSHIPHTKVHIHERLYIDLQLHDVVKDGKRLHLPKKEFQIIKLLAENPDKVFSKDEIYLSVWGSHDYDDANLLNVHIRRLRNRIEDDSNRPAVLLTRWGVGYQLIIA